MHATQRTSHTTLVRATFGALFAVLAAGAAQAAPDDLQRVEISGRRPGEIPRTDVRATCPNVDQALFERLGREQLREGAEGVSTVSFRLNGNVISEVRQNRGPQVYRQSVRRAVTALQCQGAARDTLYVMQIAFRNDAGDDMSNRIAMMELVPPAAGAPVLSASAAMADGR
ncbi:hypothetical protein ACNI65_02890 [Roseateles sp. So40a]|uniref:hypothetical protein n=1 Tax=Roseateles sp. So40a TaxID=3400226 RepID=UPI003A84CA71